MRVKIPNYADVLNVGVQNPPTEEEMKDLRRVALLVDVGGPALLAITLFAMVCESVTNPAWMGHLMQLLCLELLELGIWTFFYLIYPPIPFRLKKFQCAHALDSFERTPEGKTYLNKIRDMGREVWTFDVAAAESWARRSPNEVNKVNHEKACRRLYGIET